MKRLHDEALRIITIMNRDLHFGVNNESLRLNRVNRSSDIHITLDTGCQDFYCNFFASICKQMQLLMALGDENGAKLVLTQTKTDLSVIVEKATQSKNHIVFFIPKLENCLNFVDIA